FVYEIHCLLYIHATVQMISTHCFSVCVCVSDDFSLSSCRPCVRIAPAFNMLSNKYPQVVFLEVDVHVSAANNISATPTFLFFRNKVRLDQYQGADASGLEEKIKQHCECV
uniref:Thioredoxin domain-containing protein n=1 Tax=Sinocyclocheilus grahami TaxID=75366 RepID=A0A672LZ61_SINGR